MVCCCCCCCCNRTLRHLSYALSHTSSQYQNWRRFHGPLHAEQLQAGSCQHQWQTSKDRTQYGSIQTWQPSVTVQLSRPQVLPCQNTSLQCVRLIVSMTVRQHSLMWQTLPNTSETVSSPAVCDILGRNSSHSSNYWLRHRAVDQPLEDRADAGQRLGACHTVDTVSTPVLTSQAM